MCSGQKIAHDSQYEGVKSRRIYHKRNCKEMTK